MNEPLPTITISLEIENRYEDGSEITTHVIDAEIPDCPPPTDEDAYHEWQREHIRPFTGTGKLDGDSWYDVTVTACSNPRLIGEQFAFGY